MAAFFKSIFSFLTETLTGYPADEFFFEKILNKTFDQFYELMNSLAYGFVGVILITVGFLATYFNILSQYDRIGSVDIGAVAVGGVVLCFIGFGITYNTRKKPAKSSLATENKRIHPSPLEDALALLLLDYVKEREEERERKKQHIEQDVTKIVPDEVNIH